MKYVYFVTGRFSSRDIHFDVLITTDDMLSNSNRITSLREHIHKNLTDTEERAASTASEYVRINNISFLHTIDE